jgi:hypothetical protein
MATAYAKFINHSSRLVWENHKHYLAKRFYVYVGRDNHYESWSGKIAYVKLHVGRHAFISNDFEANEHLFIL